MSGKLRIKNLGLEINQSGGWSEINHRSEVSEKLKKQVFGHDKYTCQSCGYATSDRTDGWRYLEVHHLNGNHTDNSMRNLATICPYCHMCFHLDFAGKNRQADLIFLPELTQTELFHLYRIKEVWKLSLKGNKAEQDKKSNSRNRPGSRRNAPQEPEPEEDSDEDSNLPKDVKETIGVVDNFLSDRGKVLASIFQTSSPSEFAGAMRQQLRTDKDENLETQRKGLRHIRLLPQDMYFDNKGNDIWGKMAKSWQEYYGNVKKWENSSKGNFKDQSIPNISSLLDPK